MMPEMGGYEFMVAYRKESETPVIIHRPNPDKAAALTPLRLRRCAYAAALTPEPKRRQPPLPKSLHKKQEFRGLGTINNPGATANPRN